MILQRPIPGVVSERVRHEQQRRFLPDLDTFREPQRSFHHVEVPAPAPRPWPTGPATVWTRRIVGAGREMGVAEFLDDHLEPPRWWSSSTACSSTSGTPTASPPTDRLLGNSATKSALALVTGVAVADGRLPDLDAPIRDYVPELAASGYQDVTVRQVLTMTTGVGWVEDYHDPDSAGLADDRALARGSVASATLLAEHPAGRPPGTRYAYCSPDSMVLDWVRERATGQTFPEALAEVWQLIGAESAGGGRPRRARRATAAWRWRQVRWRDRSGLGQDRVSPGGRHVGRRTGGRPWLGRRRAAGPADRSCGRAGCRARSPRMPGSDTTGGRWTPRVTG